MKLTTLNNLLLSAVVLTLAAGCKNKPVGLTNIPPHHGAQVGDTGATPALPPGNPVSPDNNVNNQNVVGTQQPLPNPVNFDNWIANPEIFKEDAVFFDFDRASIKSSEKSKITAVAEYVRAHPGVAVRVEGNCDERGTEEYNRSLGERRALAAREDLIKQGIDGAHIPTTSWGKDKPADPGHDESAWRKNRRDEFILLTPPGATP